MHIVMQGDQAHARLYRNEVNRAAATLRKEFYQEKITALKASSSREWYILNHLWVVVVNLYSHSECMQHVSCNHVRTGKQTNKT